MRDNIEQITDDEIQVALIRGVTPRVLEHAYNNHMVQVLAREKGLKLTHLYQLKERWGIGESL